VPCLYIKYTQGKYKISMYKHVYVGEKGEVEQRFYAVLYRIVLSRLESNRVRVYIRDAVLYRILIYVHKI